jgi:hypothetical protein
VRPVVVTVLALMPVEHEPLGLPPKLRGAVTGAEALVHLASAFPDRRHKTGAVTAQADVVNDGLAAFVDVARHDLQRKG